MVETPESTVDARPLLQWLFRYIEEEGLTQDDIGNLVGVDQATVSRWKKLATRPKKVRLRSGLAPLEQFEAERTSEEYERRDRVRTLLKEINRPGALQPTGPTPVDLPAKLAYAINYATSAVEPRFTSAELQKLMRIFINLLKGEERRSHDTKPNRKTRPDSD